MESLCPDLGKGSKNGVLPCDTRGSHGRTSVLRAVSPAAGLSRASSNCHSRHFRAKLAGSARGSPQVMETGRAKVAAGRRGQEGASGSGRMGSALPWGAGAFEAPQPARG